MIVRTGRLKAEDHWFPLSTAVTDSCCVMNGMKLSVVCYRDSIFQLNV